MVIFAASCLTVQYISTYSSSSVWLTSPVFSVEMIVTDRVQTAPASAHQKHHSGIFWSSIPQFTANVFPTHHKSNVRVIYVSTYHVNAFWERVEWYFQWLSVAGVRKCVIFVTIPPENKVYLSVKRQRFTIIQTT